MSYFADAAGMVWSTLSHWPLLGLGLAAAIAATPFIYRGDNPR